MRSITLLALAFVLSAGPERADRIESARHERAERIEGGTPVVVELFTSEGCESCPPADVLLQQLASTQPVSGAQIIPLSLHVDYWDQLGWKDRFSSAALTRRQRAYGTRFNLADVYTPQMVVDGRSEFVGSDAAAARKAVAKAASVRHGSVVLELSNADPPDGRRTGARSLRVTASIADLPPRTQRADIMLAVTEDRLESKVTAGENHGRTLTHTAVVHRLDRLGEATGPTASAAGSVVVDPQWKLENVRFVAFVQEHSGGAILASGSNR
jgi:hypothetical protein